MAEIKTITSGEVTMRKIIGVVTADELVNAVLDSFAGHVTKNVVWDLSMGSVEQLTSDDLRSIADLVRTHAHTRIGGKTAIVAPADLEYGMSRMLSTFAELIDVPFDTQAFRTLSEAAKWIGVNKLPTIDDVT